MPDFIQICEQKNMNLKLALDKDGNLWKGGAAWEPVSFNENYRGYYPQCTFTAITATDMDFVAAGMGEDGLPYVYRSVMGGVWESANLMAGNALNGFVRVSGKVNRILYDSPSRQVFLLCANGELVTMPDCPKCVRVRKVSDYALTDGEIQKDGEDFPAGRRAAGKRLVLTDEHGGTVVLSQYEMTQVRASLSYVKEQLKKGGYLIDLRRRTSTECGRTVAECAGETDRAGAVADCGETAKRGGEELLEGIRKEQVLQMEMEELEEWLLVQQGDLFLAFLCEYGTQADEAAHYARRHQFLRSYSLGGAGELFHIV